MSNPQQPLPTAHPKNLEAIAQREVGHTNVSPLTTRLLLIGFVLMIAAAPIIESSVEGRPSAGGSPDSVPWAPLSRLAGEVRTYLSRPRDGWDGVTALNRTASTRLLEFERALESDSWLARSLRPPAQRVMTGVLRAGNERVYLGRDGWLFYRQDVDYLTGGSFLDRAQSDPHQAILLFHRDLEARGVTLVVMPTPVKPSVHPEKLSGHFSEAAGALHNPSFRAFVDKLRRDGVLVFDPSEDFAAARRSSPQYLATDTHWRPETMEAAAERLAAVIEASAGPLPAADPGFKVEQTAVISTGDVARMLDLPEDAAYPHEEVTLRRVTQPDGSPWRSVRTADVLLLGDSFSNIYSLETMGWGTSAGFAEHLSYALRRPIDRIVQNDEGAFATRMPLTQDPSRLIGKRVVVYQFAARELAFGDWQILPLPQSTDKTR